MRWANQRLELFADRAVHWPKTKTLIIADGHFGKAGAFRAAGVPVPGGATQANLDRLSQLLDHTSAARMIVLGDFLHARDGRADRTMQTIAAWRERHRQLSIILVRGNHDQKAGDPPEEWNFCCIDEPLIESPFAFRHTPIAACGFAATRLLKPFTFAGHVHPCAILRDRDGSSMRVACFHFSRRQAILPAFGAFTGMHPIRPVRGDRVFAAGPESIVPVRSVAGC